VYMYASFSFKLLHGTTIISFSSLLCNHSMQTRPSPCKILPHENLCGQLDWL